MALPLFREKTHHPSGKHTYINIIGAGDHGFAYPDIPAKAVVDLVGNGEAEGDCGQNKEKTQPGDEFLGLCEKAQKRQQKREKDVEPPLYGQGIRLPIEAPERREQVLGEGGESP